MTRINRRGHYPARRLLTLRKYANATPLWRVACTLILTPLPSLAVILMFEVVPLSPPSAGLDRNHLFYVREFITYYVVCVCLLQQFCEQVGPALPMSSARLASIALCLVTANVGFTYLLASQIGFPVPFTMQTSSPSYLVIETLALGIHWRGHVRANPAAIHDIARGCVFYVCQLILIVVYPVYYYAFTLVPDGGVARPAFFCLLPLLKVLSRQVFYRVRRKSGDGEEQTPQLVVFNADVMGSLFVAFCIQYKPSMAMTGIVAALKVLHVVHSLRDIRTAGRELAEMRYRAKKRAARSSSGALSVASKTCTPSLSVLDEVVDIVARYKVNESSPADNRHTHEGDKADFSALLGDVMALSSWLAGRADVKSNDNTDNKQRERLCCWRGYDVHLD